MGVSVPLPSCCMPLQGAIHACLTPACMPHACMHAPRLHACICRVSRLNMVAYFDCTAASGHQPLHWWS